MKRFHNITALVLAVLLVLSMFSVSAFAVLKGDVDGNGAVEAADARLTLRCAVGLENYAEGSDEFNACDADGNGKIEPADARLILRAAVGLKEDSTPAGTEDITPEEAARIYMKDADLWKYAEEGMPMAGYYYGIIDLDFDGIPELFTNEVDGTGRYSNVRFFGINTAAKHAEEIKTDDMTFDIGFLTGYPVLMKAKSDGSLHYYCCDLEYHVFGKVFGEDYGFINYDGSTVSAERIFGVVKEYDSVTDESKITECGTFTDNVYSKSSLTEYNAAKEKFESDYETVELTMESTSGRNFDFMTDDAQTEEMIRMCEAFTFDGYVR